MFRIIGKLVQSQASDSHNKIIPTLYHLSINQPITFYQILLKCSGYCKWLSSALLYVWNGSGWDSVTGSRSPNKLIGNLNLCLPYLLPPLSVYMFVPLKQQQQPVWGNRVLRACCLWGTDSTLKTNTSSGEMDATEWILSSTIGVSSLKGPYLIFYVHLT